MAYALNQMESTANVSVTDETAAMRREWADAVAHVTALLPSWPVHNTSYRRGWRTASENELQSYARLRRQVQYGAALKQTYDGAVQHVLGQLLRSSVGARGVRAPLHWTFAGYYTDANLHIPLLHPSACGLPGLLARGLRLGAHRDATPTRRFREAQILSAAELMAASCYDVYNDPDGAHLHSPVYFRAHARRDVVAAAATPVSRPTRFCDVPTLLLHTFYELYASTHDAVYVRWSLRLLRRDAVQCGVQSMAQLRERAVWENYFAQVRLMLSLLMRMRCVTQPQKKLWWCADMNAKNASLGAALWDAV